jgi:hypothetical protein
MRVGGAVVEEKAGGVNRHFIQQFGQSDGPAGALGHANRLAFVNKVDQLVKHGLQALGIDADRLQSGAEAQDVAVVVGAQNVNGDVKAALFQFVAVVGDVGGVVRVKTVGSDHNLVFFTAEIRCAEPCRAVFFIQMPVAAQNFHGFINIPAAMK